MANEKNVYGKPLHLCCGNTGFTREGFCYVPFSDYGNHSVCAIVTDEFLAYSKSVGNDLSTPNPQYDFPGLKEGDKWCLCASRWQQALSAGVAPRVQLSATNMKALDVIKLSDLEKHSVDNEDA
ncbi:MAG: DUF2237 domain-containing protein [Pseudomonadota bacterium]